MFEQKVIDSLSRLFGLQCVEYSGEKKKGGVLYLNYDDLKVVIKAETERTITAIVTISVLAIEGREGIGFLTGKMFDFDNKPDELSIEAIDQSESRSWLGKSTFECSKQIRIVEKIKYNQSREIIKGVNITEGIS